MGRLANLRWSNWVRFKNNGAPFSKILFNDSMYQAGQNWGNFLTLKCDFGWGYCLRLTLDECQLAGLQFISYQSFIQSLTYWLTHLLAKLTKLMLTDVVSFDIIGFLILNWYVGKRYWGNSLSLILWYINRPMVSFEAWRSVCAVLKVGRPCTG